MGEGTAQAAITFCDAGQRLLDSFWEAVQELTLFREERVQALISGDPHLERFDFLICLALQKKEHAKSAYMHHVDTHGCWAFADAVQAENQSS